jgi:DNA topoisomerase-1
MKLVIVESPTKAKTLARFLGKDYQIEASMGHVRDLPPKKLGVDVEHDFKPEYVVAAGKQKIVRALKAAASKSDEVILATDPDREGEAIAYHVKHVLSSNSQFSRIVFHEITRPAIEAALKHPGKINLPLVDAQQARRVLDRLVGYKLSPLLWRKVRRGLSAGRVQSVAVRLVVEREKEIKAFKPEEFWRIGAELAVEARLKESFNANLVQIEAKKAKVDNKDQADRIVKDLQQAVYRVAQVETKAVKRQAPPPFITSTLQRTAGTRFGWSAKKIMSVAQRLYEEGLITYHRTDSFNLANEAVAAVRKYIATVFGQNYLPEKARYYKRRSKMVQGAHEAIRPTRAEKTESGLGRDMERLYRLIWQRFVACQMRPAVFDKTKIEVKAKGEREYLLRTEGERMKFDGWMVVNGKGKAFNSQFQDEAELAEVKAGKPLQLIKVEAEQKFTQPPPRFTEASLIRVLEEKGIGRPSTYAPILSTIQARQYVEKIEKKLHPTPVGMAVTEFLLQHFPKVMDYGFTAAIEDDLDRVAQGEKKWVKVVGEFYQPFGKRLDEVTEKAGRVKIETEKTGEKCPQCSEGEVVIRVGRFGKFLSCSRFPECDYKTNYKEVVEGVKCAQCGAEVVVKKTRKGKRFYGCGNYPKCNWASWTKPKRD